MGIEYIETSSITEDNYKEPFEILAKEILLLKKGKLKEYKKNFKTQKRNKNITDSNLELATLLKYINF